MLRLSSVLLALSMGAGLMVDCVCARVDVLDSLANQEVLRWILAMEKAVGSDATHDQIKEYLWTTLKGGQVIPGLAASFFAVVVALMV